uniref:ATP synthase F0 subunit 8 n=1 Tax=Macoma balthica TaxID=1903275 RepID=A0A6B7FS34_MACBL|nr:ATP synthase F0 subunit 8 [Macoma balthica]
MPQLAPMWWVLVFMCSWGVFISVTVVLWWGLRGCPYQFKYSAG